MKAESNILWIDCEMTGLDSKHDCIIEIAAIATDAQLCPLDKGIRYAVKTDSKVLDAMGEWCKQQHGESGLIKECLDATYDMQAVDKQVAQYVHKYFLPGKAVLAGSSVHMDRIYLEKDMPKVFQCLHYRIIDISSIKELAHRWFPGWRKNPRKGPGLHRALDDILDSIDGASWRV